MKKLYPLSALVSVILLTHGAQAQTGGTYTAVRDGNWHVTSGPNVWDPSGEPPTNCNNCAVIINSGVTVTLNTHVVLSGSSTLQVGSAGSGAIANLLIPASGGTDWATGYNVILPNDGSSPANRILLIRASDKINASSAGTYDGVLTSFITSGVTTYFKQLGNAPSGFVETTVASNSPAAYGTTLAGEVTLSANGTLPVTLEDFDAAVSGGEVSLTWKTAMEQNSSRFDIERSSNGGAKWEVIGSVAAKGQSITVVNYAFTDANPGSGTLQYRLHEYDLDGRPALSDIKVVRLSTLATVSIFPNPAKDYVNVSLPVSEATAGAVSVRLFGQSGQLLAEKNVKGAGGTILSFPVSSYAPGNYLVQVVTADGARQVNKVVISKQ
ncbi:T9SS type A sorting domain-containing protein [Flavitalea sp. BT771]|uniref:T9SS type A sorting domain-containing protein n=1 Tax=Flavitalea sp. BT771 TaxID=3063329 RepID=UPI0026E46E6B|nr:T9SS type A sorting domain-containing protein [Flavitalea sp. BT771]MDO6432564.1 T9SS type A sorting domain-containing protein [Flavitalea sp. BT771]MDV6222160.1 T9SS type A sorting domain-containing protein [Flavitalea sp. BT771]